MPVPSVPRRAAPPRKKIPKSPSPVPDTHILDNPLKDSPETSVDIKTGAVAESEHELQADRQEEIGEVDKEGVGDLPEAHKSSAPAPMLSDGHMVDEPPQVEESENETKEVFRGDHGTREPEIYIGEPAETHGDSSDIPASAEKETNPAQAGEWQEDAVEESNEDLTEEEEEVARRKRVAEKLGNMGGFNPLAPPPVASPPANDGAERKGSISEDVEHPVASPTKFVSETTKQGSRDSAIAPPASSLVHQSTDSPLPASENFPNSRSLSSPTTSAPSSSTSLTSPYQFTFSDGSVSQERPEYDHRRLASEIEAPTRKESTKSVESGNRPDPVSQEDGEY
jgi:myosin tail region-interacting protein MTI1